MDYLEKFSYVLSWITDILESGGEMIQTEDNNLKRLDVYNCSNTDAEKIKIGINELLSVANVELRIGWGVDSKSTHFFPIVFILGDKK